MTSANDGGEDAPELGRRIEFDVFISHAYEDKDSFVRPLATALEARRLRLWYDEFTLRPGDSLRRSIDHGLLTSQAGIVILSPAFFGKQWTNYELDGLVQFNAGAPEQVAGSGSGGRLIPVWHEVDARAVTRYSPSLANLVALRSSDGIEAVADRILALLRPTGSALLFAYEELRELGKPLGWHPPVVTSDWWLDVIEASAKTAEAEWSNPGFPIKEKLTIQDILARGRPSIKACKGHWGFPLPEYNSEPRARGHRMARAAAQIMWQRANEDLKISQITPPDQVLDFIKNHPGLADACIENLACTLSYAPQLALPPVAGWFQEAVDAAYVQARELVRAQGFDPDSQAGGAWLIISAAGYLALHDIELAKANPQRAAFVWMEGALGGLTVRVYEAYDYIGWLFSESSRWLGSEMRYVLWYGIAERGEWPPSEETLSYLDDKHRNKTQSYIAECFAKTTRRLRLDETGDELADRLLATRYLDILEDRRSRRRSGELLSLRLGSHKAGIGV
jgi:TIR domain